MSKRCEAVKVNWRAADFTCMLSDAHTVHIDKATGMRWRYPYRGVPFGMRLPLKPPQGERGKHGSWFEGSTTQRKMWGGRSIGRVRLGSVVKGLLYVVKER